MQSTSKISLPAIKGVQSGRIYYTAMCPIPYLVGLFKYNDASLPPTMRSQRVLNKARIPKMRDYVLTGDYTFSALTASIDGKFEFVPYSQSELGVLNINADARIIINDGQHRRQALIEALECNAKLNREHIVVVFYTDMGLVRSQQMFSDLNRYAMRPTKSLNILYDNRDEFARLVRESIDQIEGFKGRIEVEKTSIGNRSRALYTLNGVSKSAELLTNGSLLDYKTLKKLVIDFYTEAYNNIEEWKQVIAGKIAPCNYRKEYITGHTIFIKALGRAGKELIARYNKKDFTFLKKLKGMNFKRNNPEFQGIIMHGPKINGSEIGIVPLANYILKNMGEAEIC